MRKFLFNATTPPKVGVLPEGPHNRLSDVAGVTVGQVTLNQGNIQTGVTVIYPHHKDLFLHKVAAGTSVINGFGKSIGLIQLEELGVIETPIALSNTFAVPILAQAQIRQAFTKHPQIGREWPTVNPLVLECNDGILNDIQAFAIQEAHYYDACSQQQVYIEQGSVGAGRGMRSFGLKGGIGTASRYVSADKQHLVSALVLSNFGALPYLQIQGHAIGQQIEALQQLEAQIDKGSIIIILATDAPLDARQLKRLSMRAAAGLARTGSNYGHGSGDIAVAFSTSNIISHDKTDNLNPTALIHESALNDFFNAAAEATEQAIINALWYATEVTGRNGHHCPTLMQHLQKLELIG
ncbi:MAG: P1 family peptidase [Pelistega sp.]|nr:P1 family peptidase [Pelistega sp.]